MRYGCAIEAHTSSSIPNRRFIENLNQFGGDFWFICNINEFEVVKTLRKTKQICR